MRTYFVRVLGVYSDIITLFYYRFAFHIVV